jgi:hypothetical protein
MTEPMDLTRFEDLVMTHGPDPDAWPKHLRADAEALLAASPAARAAHDAAAALFDALDADAADPEPAPDALLARILVDAAEAAPVAVPRPGPARRRGASFGFFWRFTPPAALAASALLGIALGYSAPDSLTGDVTATADDEIWIEALNLTKDPGLFGDIEEGDGL